MKKLLIIFAIIFLFMPNVMAKSGKNINVSKYMEKILNESKVPESLVSISIRDAENGSVIYGLNDKVLMHPASVQKVLTILPIAECLGENYEFKTELYKRKTGEYLIKLGADPYFTSSDLKYLVKSIDKSTVNKIFIDDSITDKKDWGEGWQWDDDLNVSMPRFGAYNIDSNLIKITIMPDEKNNRTFIINPSKAPVNYINNTSLSEKNDVEILRNNFAPNSLTINGTIKTPKQIMFPNNNLKLYFDSKLTNLLEDRHIYLKEPYTLSRTTSTDILVEQTVHPISQAIDDILLNSNNMVIESLSKIAGAKRYNKSGEDVDGIRLFNEFCKKNGIDNSQIRLVDASGVSKNNLVSSDFVSEYLYKNKSNKVYEKMAYPGVGTLSNRMIPLQNNLKAKTGTLSDISSIAGFLTSKSGQKYSFCIIINSPSIKSSDKKLLEDYLIREVYLRL